MGNSLWENWIGRFFDSFKRFESFNVAGCCCPSFQGKYDASIVRVLKQYYKFILFGILGIILLIIQSGLAIKLQ
jgi:hypothetical protein